MPNTEEQLRAARAGEICSFRLQFKNGRVNWSYKSNTGEDLQIPAELWSSTEQLAKALGAHSIKRKDF